MGTHDFLALLFEWRGRINRAQYWIAWIFYAFYFGATVFAYFIASLFMTFASSTVGILFMLLAVLLSPMVVSAVFVSIKRLHDRDKSGWWVLVFYAAPAVLNGIGPHTNAESLFSLAVFVLSIWGFIELGCLRGTLGPNRYGSDPLVADAKR